MTKNINSDIHQLVKPTQSKREAKKNKSRNFNPYPATGNDTNLLPGVVQIKQSYTEELSAPF